MNSLASAGVLYIFQLAAIIFFLMSCVGSLAVYFKSLVSQYCIWIQQVRLRAISSAALLYASKDPFSEEDEAHFS